MKFKYKISGVDCPVCASKLSEMFLQIEGVVSAKINFLTEKLVVEAELSEDELLPELCDAAKRFSKLVKIEK